MKAAWDKLGDEFADSSSVVIGDADCTASGKDLCEKFEVRGYPTVKYFVDGDAKGADYQGGRDFDSLKKHVVDKLEVKCDVGSPDACDDKEKKYIDKMKGKTATDRAKQLKRLDGMKGNSMKADLKKWLSQRLNILKQLTKDEL